MYIWFDFNFILTLLRKKAIRKHVLLFPHLLIWTCVTFVVRKNSFNFNIKTGRKYIIMLIVIFFN